MTDGPSYLSPSGLSAWRKCKASWWYTYMEDNPREPATEAMVRGTFVHAVFERLIWLPPRLRTADEAKRIATVVWGSWLDLGAEPDFTALELDEQQINRFAAWTWRSIQRGLPHIAEIDVVATELKVRVDLDGTPFSGFIDLVTADAVEDYKTGEYPESGKPWSQARVDGLMLQPLLYAAALREMGRPVSKAALVFIPGEGRQGVLSDDATDAALDAVVETLGVAWGEIQEAIADGEVPETTTSALCGWCNWLAMCPDGQADVRARHERGANVGEQAVKILGLG